MATYFRNAIHLESMPPWTNSGDLYRTFDHADMTVETLQVNDTNNNGQIVVDNSNTGYETISYDVGSGVETEEIARSVYARATVKLKDGTTLTDKNVHVFQTDTGVTFLNEFGESGQLDNLNIETITITSIIVDSFTNADMSSSLTGTTVCFASNTRISAPDGPVLVEDLRPGDIVLTRDHGPRPVSAVLEDPDAGQGRNAPIAFAPGSIAPGLPHRTLRVSPQHRMVCASALVQRMFDVPEVLLPALRFVGLPGVTQDKTCAPVTYHHITLSSHGILYAEGVPVESCLMGPEALKTSPFLAQTFGFTESVPCRLIPEVKRQRRLVDRLSRNNHPIYAGPVPPVAAAASPRGGRGETAQSFEPCAQATPFAGGAPKGGATKELT